MSDIEKYRDNPRYQVLKNGAVYDLEAGRIVAIDPTQNPYAITKENARAMLARRQELAQQTARDALDEVVIELGKMDPRLAGSGEAYKLYCQKYFTEFFATKNFRAMTEGFIRGAQAMGYMPTQKVEIENTHTVELDPLFVDAIQEALKILQPKSIEGEVIAEDAPKAIE